MSQETDFSNFIARNDKIPSFEQISEWVRYKPSTVLSDVKTLHSYIMKNFVEKELLISSDELKRVFNITVPEYVSVSVFRNKTNKRYICNVLLNITDTYNKSNCTATFRFVNPIKLIAFYGFGRREISKSFWKLMWLVQMYNNTPVKLLNNMKQQKKSTKGSDDDELGEIKQALKQLTLTVQLLANSVVGDEK